MVFVQAAGMDNCEETLPLSPQACKECTRRKSKCDKALPVCAACSRFKRHCLYTKHSKSPLTRKYLTIVEARLERAETLLQIYRSGSKSSNGELLQKCVVGLEPTESVNLQRYRSSHASQLSQDLGASEMYPQNGSPEPPERDHMKQLRNEEIVLRPDDFGWDETKRPMSFGDARSYKKRIEDLVDPIHDTEDGIALDGMATLTLNEKDYGYIGSAAGLAFLRYLWVIPSSQNLETQSAGLESSVLTSPKIPPCIDSKLITATPFIDAYFATVHCIYPLVHEATFRAAFSMIIPRPGGKAWPVLANLVAALGAFSAMTKCLTIDTPFYYAAKESLSLDFLESGNITLVQALILMANYLQKRNKPNSSYNYAGLARRMAYGIGLHREFPQTGKSELQREMRRRLWWSVYVIDNTISMTLSRPLSTENEAINAKLPANIHESDLTNQDQELPVNRNEWTIYSALRAQARFFKCSGGLYGHAISNRGQDPEKLIRADDEAIVTWSASVQGFDNETFDFPREPLALSHAIVLWRMYNLRNVIYRPFALQQQNPEASDSTSMAVGRSLHACHQTIESAAAWWSRYPRTRIAAWYILYFIFQAALVPITCLRKFPKSPSAKSWGQDIRMALGVIEDMHFIHSSKCAAVIHELVDDHMNSPPTPNGNHDDNSFPIGCNILANDHSDDVGPELVGGASKSFDFGLGVDHVDNDMVADAWTTMWPGVSFTEQTSYENFWPR